jgi:ribonuclease HI
VFASTAVKEAEVELDSPRSRDAMSEESVNMMQTLPDAYTDESLYEDSSYITRVFEKQEDDGLFAESREKELRGLLERGTFVVVKRERASGKRIYGTRFVDAVKSYGTSEAVTKSRLVVQAFNDRASRQVLTGAPTVQRFSQRLLLSMAACFPDMKLFTRDVTQAYIQAETELTREVYVEAPSEMGLTDDEILLVRKPLYGLPEAGVHWFATYSAHHIKHLGMKQSPADPCLFYKASASPKPSLEGISCLQVDDSLSAGRNAFVAEEEKHSRRFLCKPAQFANLDTDLTYNGVRIRCLRDGGFSMKQEQVYRLEQVATADAFITARARGSYVATCTRPDLAAPYQLLAGKVRDPDSEDFRQLNKVIARTLATRDVGLSFVPLNAEEVAISVFADAAFANASGFGSQLGFVICMTDGQRANVVHYASQKCKRITRSVMAAELYALVHAVDTAFLLRYLVSKMLSRRVALRAYTDSKTVFDCVTKLIPTSEKRLLIDLYGLRQSYERRELDALSWISGEHNPADALTKPILSDDSPLFQLMTENRLDPKILAWVERGALQSDGDMAERSSREGSAENRVAGVSPSS